MGGDLGEDDSLGRAEQVLQRDDLRVGDVMNACSWALTPSDKERLFILLSPQRVDRFSDADTREYASWWTSLGSSHPKDTIRLFVTSKGDLYWTADKPCQQPERDGFERAVKVVGDVVCGIGQELRVLARIPSLPIDGRPAKDPSPGRRVLLGINERYRRSAVFWGSQQAAWNATADGYRQAARQLEDWSELALLLLGAAKYQPYVALQLLSWIPVPPTEFAGAIEVFQEDFFTRLACGFTNPARRVMTPFLFLALLWRLRCVNLPNKEPVLCKFLNSAPPVWFAEYLRNPGRADPPVWAKHSNHHATWLFELLADCGPPETAIGAVNLAILRYWMRESDGVSAGDVNHLLLKADAPERLLGRAYQCAWGHAMRELPAVEQASSNAEAEAARGADWPWPKGTVHTRAQEAARALNDPLVAWLMESRSEIIAAAKKSVDAAITAAHVCVKVSPEPRTSTRLDWLALLGGVADHIAGYTEEAAPRHDAIKLLQALHSELSRQRDYPSRVAKLEAFSEVPDLLIAGWLRHLRSELDATGWGRMWRRFRARILLGKLVTWIERVKALPAHADAHSPWYVLWRLPVGSSITYLMRAANDEAFAIRISRWGPWFTKLSPPRRVDSLAIADYARWLAGDQSSEVQRNKKRFIEAEVAYFKRAIENVQALLVDVGALAASECPNAHDTPVAILPSANVVSSYSEFGVQCSELQSEDFEFIPLVDDIFAFEPQHRSAIVVGMEVHVVRMNGRLVAEYTERSTTRRAILPLYRTSENDPDSLPWWVRKKYPNARLLILHGCGSARLEPAGFTFQTVLWEALHAEVHLIVLGSAFGMVRRSHEWEAQGTPLCSRCSIERLGWPTSHEMWGKTKENEKVTGVGSRDHDDIGFPELVQGLAWPVREPVAVVVASGSTSALAQHQLALSKRERVVNV